MSGPRGVCGPRRRGALESVELRLSPPTSLRRLSMRKGVIMRPRGPEPTAGLLLSFSVPLPLSFHSPNSLFLSLSLPFPFSVVSSFLVRPTLSLVARIESNRDRNREKRTIPFRSFALEFRDNEVVAKRSSIATFHFENDSNTPLSSPLSFRESFVYL